MSQDTQQTQQIEGSTQSNNQQLTSPEPNSSAQKNRPPSLSESPAETISLLNFNPQSKSRQFLTR